MTMARNGEGRLVPEDARSHLETTKNLTSLHRALGCTQGSPHPAPLTQEPFHLLFPPPGWPPALGQLSLPFPSLLPYERGDSGPPGALLPSAPRTAGAQHTCA